MTGKNRHFTLFQSHLDLAHRYWQELINPGDLAIDATAGNGYDTILLANMVGLNGRVISFDIQLAAIESTRIKLDAEQLVNRVELIHGSHEIFPETIQSNSVSLVVYNLGYLPGGDKNCFTRVDSTLTSVRSAANLIKPGGMISITCYPGHEEGAKEEKAIIETVSKWDPAVWSISRMEWLNRNHSPSLLLIQKSAI
jgi:predicted methyltransferase